MFLITTRLQMNGRSERCTSSKPVLWFLILCFFSFSACEEFLPEPGLALDRASCADKELMEKAQTYFNPLPSVKWAGSEAESWRVRLGEKLFKEVLLSQNKTQSCNSCHPLDAYGVDGKRFSKGAFGEEGTRNTPTVYNAVFNLAQFWDGRAADLEEQALFPIFNEREMAIRDSAVLLGRLQEQELYRGLFAKAFPDAEQPLSMSNLAKALAAFEETLLTPSRFDRYLLGDEQALSEKEKKGLAYFLDLGCSPCHSGTGVGGSMYQPFGVVGYYWDYTGSEMRDEGRYTFTGDPSERYWFKVPSLRNVAKTAPYFHDGSVSDLAKAVQAMASAQLNRPLEKEELEALLAFLESLTGELPD